MDGRKGQDGNGRVMGGYQVPVPVLHCNCSRWKHLGTNISNQTSTCHLNPKPNISNQTSTCHLNPKPNISNRTSTCHLFEFSLFETTYSVQYQYPRVASTATHTGTGLLLPGTKHRYWFIMHMHQNVDFACNTERFV